MLLKMITAAAATLALGGAAAAQQLPPADGLPPLNSGIPKTPLPPMVGTPIAPIGTASDTATSVGATEGTGDDSIKDALGREIGKMSNAPKTTQPLGVASDLGKDANVLAPSSLMRPGAGLTTYSGQSSTWVPK